MSSTFPFFATQIFKQLTHPTIILCRNMIKMEMVILDFLHPSLM